MRLSAALAACTLALAGCTSASHLLASAQPVAQQIEVQIIADNYGVEAVPALPGPDNAEHPSLPIHNHCLFKLGLNLGELWYSFTGHPFVFALWIVRRDSAAVKHAVLKTLAAQLLDAKRLAYDSYEAIAAACLEKRWISAEALVEYWRTISYDLTPAHRTGLQTFYRFAAELGLLPREPKIILFTELTTEL